jgi:hypothetical protein
MALAWVNRSRSPQTSAASESTLSWHVPRM